MSENILTLAGALVGSALLDMLVRPRPRLSRDWPGLWLLACLNTALYGLFVLLCGNGAVAMALTLAVHALLMAASNAKYAMLGEPLLFSDLALVGAVFRHPQFYLSAIRLWQRVTAGLVAALLLGVIVWFSSSAAAAHLAGLGLIAGGLSVLAVSLWLPPWRSLALTPNAAADLRRFGLFPVLLLYWRRWRAAPDPAPCPDSSRAALADAPEVVVVVQCESFADPVELFGDPTLALPGLTAARKAAMQWGDLNVSGFGAYTMRTEYGVLFGRDEAALGFRRYDPFLTASGEGSYALPARLRASGGDWRALFVHPHDLRFYNRDAIMPACGFTALVGEEKFSPPAPAEGRYVTDAAMADKILAELSACTQPSLVYAVTIENHGPWAADARNGTRKSDLIDGYMRLVRNGDAMLSALIQGIKALDRPALLVFFGDHRPSIPGASLPGGARHTPYVMVRTDGQGNIAPGANRRIDLSPAALHHATLDTVLGPAVSDPAA